LTVEQANPSDAKAWLKRGFDAVTKLPDFDEKEVFLKQLKKQIMGATLKGRGMCSSFVDVSTSLINNLLKQEVTLEGRTEEDEDRTTPSRSPHLPSHRPSYSQPL